MKPPEQAPLTLEEAKALKPGDNIYLQSNKPYIHPQYISTVFDIGKNGAKFTSYGRLNFVNLVFSKYGKIMHHGKAEERGWRLWRNPPTREDMNGNPWEHVDV